MDLHLASGLAGLPSFSTRSERPFFLVGAAVYFGSNLASLLRRRARMNEETAGLRGFRFRDQNRVRQRVCQLFENASPGVEHGADL